MKICRKCLKELPDSEFNKRGKSLQSYCRNCQAEIAKNYYLSHKNEYKNKNKYYKSYLNNIISSYKNRPCADCNQRYPSFVMNFYYREGEVKEFEISPSSGKGKVKLLLEMSKCDVICSNCLKIRQHST